jgi:hypothetical protein
VVDGLVMFLTKEQQCLHDLVARTKVVAGPRDVFGLDEVRLFPAAVTPEELKRSVGLWRVLSFLSIVLGLGLLGLVPIVWATRANDALRQGEHADAQKHLRVAQVLCVLGYVWLVVTLVAYATSAFAPFAATR